MNAWLRNSPILVPCLFRLPTPQNLVPQRFLLQLVLSSFQVVFTLSLNRKKLALKKYENQARIRTSSAVSFSHLLFLLSISACPLILSSGPVLGWSTSILLSRRPVDRDADRESGLGLRLRRRELFPAGRLVPL